MKKVLSLLLLTFLLAGLAVQVSALPLGSGVAVIAGDTELIKTGLVGQKMYFSDTDFKTALSITDFDKVTFTSIPTAAEGVLMLSGRRVGEGQSVRRRNLGALVFIPASRAVTECHFTFTVDDYAAGAELRGTLRFIEKVNYAPRTGSEANETLAVTTQRDISCYGRLSASDPEGDALKFMIVSYPSCGRLTLLNSASGEYRYTPASSQTGRDSFVYVVRDAYGNYSTPARVTVNVTERMSEVVYADMADSEDYNAAVAMTALGIMNGRILGDSQYFMPGETVSRAEFLTMTMRACGIQPDTTLSTSYFDDNARIPAPLVSYVATAQRCGIVNGSYVMGKGLLFRPGDAITRYEAAVILSRLCPAGEDSVTTLAGSESIPVWARVPVASMLSLGIYESEEDGGVTEAVTRADCARYLYRLMMR